MRPLPVVVAAFGGAVGVAFVAVLLDEPEVRYAAGTAATAALVGWAAWGGRETPPAVRRLLIAFCLLLTAGAVVDLAGRLTPYPADGWLAEDGCLSTAHYDFWRGQLRAQQLAALLRCAALAAAAVAVRPARNDPQRPAALALALALALACCLVALISFRPISAAADEPGRVAVAVPGALALLAAITLTALAASRPLGTRTASWILALSTLPMLYRETAASKELADLHWQLPRPALTDERITTDRACSLAVAEAPPVPFGELIGPAVLTALVLAAPALFLWAILRPAAPPDNASVQRSQSTRRAQSRGSGNPARTAVPMPERPPGAGPGAKRRARRRPERREGGWSAVRRRPVEVALAAALGLPRRPTTAEPHRRLDAPEHVVRLDAELGPARSAVAAEGVPLEAVRGTAAADLDDGAPEIAATGQRAGDPDRRNRLFRDAHHVVICARTDDPAGGQPKGVVAGGRGGRRSDAQPDAGGDQGADCA
uniref:hypothetical protein n=1 Tax=Paractinoplanes polyasparticus TaxID=2856853 RepID=UPI001C858F0D|nr:hypothetical protein [Actinoplanes polyasparticus]